MLRSTPVFAGRLKRRIDACRYIASVKCQINAAGQVRSWTKMWLFGLLPLPAGIAAGLDWIRGLRMLLNSASAARFVRRTHRCSPILGLLRGG